MELAVRTTDKGLYLQESDRFNVRDRHSHESTTYLQYLQCLPLRGPGLLLSHKPPSFPSAYTYKETVTFILTLAHD